MKTALDQLDHDIYLAWETVGELNHQAEAERAGFGDAWPGADEDIRSAAAAARELEAARLAVEGLIPLSALK